MKNLKQEILRYWLAMNATALDSAVHALVAFYGVAAGHALVESIPVLNGQQFASIFLVAFGREILSYIDSHPVEKLISGVLPNAATGNEAGK